MLDDLAEDPGCFLGAASVDGQPKTSVTIVVYNLNESRAFWSIIKDHRLCLHGFPVNTSHMYLWTHLHCGWTTVDGLSLQSDFAAIRPEAGPVPDNSGMLKQQQKKSSSIFHLWRKMQKRDHIKHNHRQSSHWPLDSVQADRHFPRFPYDLRKCCVHSSFQSGKHHRRSPGCSCRHMQDSTLEILTDYKTVVVIPMWNKELVMFSKRIAAPISHYRRYSHPSDIYPTLGWCTGYCRPPFLYHGSKSNAWAKERSPDNKDKSCYWWWKHFMAILNANQALSSLIHTHTSMRCYRSSKAIAVNVSPLLSDHVLVWDQGLAAGLPLSSPCSWQSHPRRFLPAKAADVRHPRVSNPQSENKDVIVNSRSGSWLTSRKDSIFLW